MKEKTKNILKIVLTILDTILHLFIKKHEDTTSQHPEQSEGQETKNNKPQI